MNKPRHPKRAKVIWFNQLKQYGEYESKSGPVFFTAYDCKANSKPAPGHVIELRQTLRRGLK